MKERLVKFAAAAALVAWAVPFVVARRMNFGVLREGHGGHPEVALTFEGGPDDETVLVLDTLAERDVRATFLFDPAAASRRRDVLRRTVDEGHEVGVFALFGVRRGRADLERWAGRPIRLWRTGLHDVMTPWRARRANLRLLGWSARGTPSDVLRRLDPGSVVSLTEVNDLPEWLDEVRARGYRFVTASDMKGLRSETTRGLLVRVWRRLVDERFDHVGQLDILTHRARGIARVGLSRYDGPPLTLSDGSVVTAGEVAADIHVHSKRLVALADLSALTGLRAFRDSLKDVAVQLESNPKYRDARIVFAFSLFHDVLTPLGFQVVGLENPLKERVLSVGMNALRRLYGTRTDRRVIVPKIAWMERHEFLRRYGSGMKR